MDKEKLTRLMAMLDDILPDGEPPAPHELDDDAAAIEMYDAMANLIEAMKNCGF